MDSRISDTRARPSSGDWIDRSTPLTFSSIAAFSSRCKKRLNCGETSPSSPSWPTPSGKDPASLIPAMIPPSAAHRFPPTIPDG